jgi:translation initiation factor 3 subunit E
MNDYDLTPTMAPYLDAHLMFSLLDSLRELKIYDKTEITREKIKVVSRTNMVELAIELMDEVEALPGDAEKRAALQARAINIHKELDTEPFEVTKVRTFFADSEKIAELKQSQNLTLEYLAANHNITANDLNAYFRRGKFEFECGQYNQAATMLNEYISVPQTSSSVWLAALWGRLACHMLTGRWNETAMDIQTIKDIIDNRNIAPVDQIRQRAWLLHWALFVHTNRPDGVDALAGRY